MRVEALASAGVAAVVVVAMAIPVFAQSSPPGDPNGKPDDTVEGTIPGGPGNPGDEDQDASSLGCPAGGEPWWHQATQAQVEAARGAGLLTDPEDLQNEALMGGANLWSFCDTNQGYALWDYRESEGTPMIPFEDLIEKPDPQLHPDNGRVVVSLPVWLTLDNGGQQELDMPAAAGQFRAVPELVIWKTGVGNESVTCLDITGENQVVSNLDPPPAPRSDPPADACLHEYDRPSTTGNAGADGAYEIILEVTYGIEWIPPGGTAWVTYPFDAVAVSTSEPEPVRVAELQAVAVGD